MGLFWKKKAPAEEAVVEEVTVAVEETPAVEEEVPVAVPAEEAAPVVEEPVVEEPVVEEPVAEEPVAEEAPELTEKEKGIVFKVRMNYHAGYDQYKEWPNGGRTIHAGVGWFHPFGPSEYYGMANIPEEICPGGICQESLQFPLEDHFSEFWMKEFETDLFCIYRLPDGDIYAWDGMFAVRGVDPGKCVVYNSVYARQDVLVNVIVGGTGRYVGARGILIGTAEGGGDTKVVGEMPDGSPLELPATIMKDLEGYMRLPE